MYKGPLNYCFKLLNKDDGMHFSLFGLHLTVTASQDYEYDTDSTRVTCQSCYSLKIGCRLSFLGENKVVSDHTDQDVLTKQSHNNSGKKLFFWCLLMAFF